MKNFVRRSTKTTTDNDDLLLGMGVRTNDNLETSISEEADEDNYDEKKYFKSEFKIYRKRWLMLFYISSLNLISDWVCYSVAPIASLVDEEFGGAIRPTLLIVIFFVANSISTMYEPTLLRVLGLRKIIMLGSALLLAGNVLKSGMFPSLLMMVQKNQQQFEISEWRFYVAFFLVGLSQPLYQCTPAVFSACWFPEKERTLATGVALNSNQLGIGFAFIFGSLMVQQKEDIPKYFECLSIASLFSFIGIWFHFEDSPPTKPSETAKVMKGSMNMNSVEEIITSCTGGKNLLDDINSEISSFNVDDSNASAVTVPISDYAESDYCIATAYSVPSTSSHKVQIISNEQESDRILRLFQVCSSNSGFLHALTAFTISGMCINTLSTYMDYLIQGPKKYVGIIGGTFQLVIMLSSLLFGRITDITRAYSGVIHFLLLAGAVFLALCALTLKKYDLDDFGEDIEFSKLNWHWLPIAAMIGPLQPVATELGVEVVYPTSENSVLVLLQLCSNCMTAIYIPIFGLFRGYGRGFNDVDDDQYVTNDRPEFLAPLYITILIHAIATVFFATFDGKYLRLEEERLNDGQKKTTNTLSLPSDELPLLGGSVETSQHSERLYFA